MALLGLAAAVLRPAPEATTSAGGPAWSTTWAAAPSSAVSRAPAGYPGHTFRNVVHTSIGGPRLRLRLTNRYGSLPVTFGHVTVALSRHPGGTADPSDGSATPATMRDVRFAGALRVTVPAGADLLSDPVPLAVPADVDLLVSVWTPDPSGTVTQHVGANQQSFFSAGPADQAAAAGAAPFPARMPHWFYLAAVEVAGGPGTIVTLGDSITDSGASAMGANHRWPDLLAARLTTPRYGVANSGISGNRLLLDGGHPRADPFSIAGRSAVARFDPDVLERAGVRTVIILIGINDLLLPPPRTDPAPIIAGLRELVARAHARGLRVIVGTLTPAAGWHSWTPAAERTRTAVNDWIRTSREFDGMADFDQAVRDPADPARLRPGFDGGDHLHPNDEGNRALAAAVPLDRL